MSVVQLPLPDSTTPHQQMNVDLDGVTYLLDLVWNPGARSWEVGSWYLSLYQQDEVTPVINSVRIVTNKPMLAAQLPGFLLATSAQPLQGLMSDLTTMQLFYFDAAERAAILAGTVEYGPGAAS